MRSPTPALFDEDNVDAVSLDVSPYSPPRTPKTPKRKRVVDSSSDNDQEKCTPDTPTPKRKMFV
jgi:hypothetical protein